MSLHFQHSQYSIYYAIIFVSVSDVRVKINDEFKKFQSVSDPAEITNLLKVATETEEMLRTKVIQAQQIRPNVFRKCTCYFACC
jgi:hypothetical protein